MFKRKIISELEQWKGNEAKKALLLKGARQVGKTTTIREFGRTHYKNLVEINFEENPKAREAFSGALDERTIVFNLSAMGYGPFEKGETLVFFDEIQSCPAARTAIKFLVEAGSYDYIESGSLLGINYKDVSSFPVGFEHQVEMYPLDFEEYLWAIGIPAVLIDEIWKCYETMTPVPDFLHEQLMGHLRKYMVIGGMPEAVSASLNDADFHGTEIVQSSILNGYRDDVSKYAGAQKNLVKAIFDSIPSQLSKADKRFVLASLEKGASQRKYGDAVQWLADAGVCLLAYNLNSFEQPFSLYEKRNLYKIYFLDSGLLARMCLNGNKFDFINGEIGMNEGALTENFVATELSKHGHRLNYYDKKSRQELDFVYRDHSGTTIIEVKSGNSHKAHASLNAALQDNGDKICKALVLSKFNLTVEARVAYLPLYMAMFL